MIKSDTQELFKRLVEPFPPEQINWRVLRSFNMREELKSKFPGATKWAVWSAYIDARHIQERFDDVFTPIGWKVNYRADSGMLICEISVKIGDEWITKADGSHISDLEHLNAADSTKAGFTGAFKRAAVVWGVGRYLYRLGNVIAPTNDSGQKLVTFELPSWALPGGSGKPEGKEPKEGWVRYKFVGR